MDVSNIKSGAEIKKGEISIIRKLGEGYGGVVYLAHDEIRNQNVAIKFLKKTEKNHELWIKRFKREYKKQLIGKEFSNIAEIYQFGRFHGSLYFTSEYVSDANLFRACRGIPINKAVGLFIQMFEGLDFIHRSGILHLDIKAENVLVKTEGEKTVVKIVDFGLAAETPQEIQVAGTPLYISPEVVLGQKEKISARSDLFSAAVLMYYCLTTTFPFCDRWSAGNLKDVAKKLADELPPEPLTKFRRDVPEYLNSIVLRLLATDPDERFYPNARAVLNSLLTNSSESFGTGVLQSYLRPIGNKHIGRADLQAALKSKLTAISNAQNAGQSGDSSIFIITGNYGLGKTHLLERLKEEAAISPESLYVSAISFPADELSMESWESELQKELSENKRSVLILADDIHNGDPGGKSGTALFNIINAISDRKRHFDLYGDIKPIMLVMAAEPFESGQELLKENEKDDERFDWSKIARNGGALFWEIKPFSKQELLEYLKATPALKDREISEKWLKDLMWTTSGFPADISVHLEEKDAKKMLFSPDGSLIVPCAIEPDMDEPSVNITSLKRMPLPTKERLQKQYAKLEPLEREVINFISVWDHRHVAKPVTEDDVIGFFYSPAIKQAICNLIDKSAIRYVLSVDSPPKDSRTIVLAHPYMQAVIYEQMQQTDKEAIHDTIAGYLKADKDGILLHRGYGSDKRAGAKALIKLAQKSVREIGNLKLAVELLKDSLNKIDKEITPKLAELVQVLLIEYHTNTGNYMEAESIFDIALAEIEKIFFPGMRVWKVQLYRRVIPAITQAHNFVKAEQLAGEALKLVKSGDIINEIAIKNCRARVLYEKFFYEGGDIELLKEAKHKYEETRKLEATVPEENRNRILNNEAGFISISLGKYAEAAQDLELKFQRDKKEKKFFGEIATAIALANTYQLLEDYKAAEKFALSALRLAKIAKQGKWLFEAHHVLANVYHDLAEGYHDSDKTDLAICEGNKCAALGAGMGKITESVLQLWVTIADCYKVQKDNDRAIMFIEAAKKAGAAGYHLMRAEVVLGEIYYDKHDYKASHSHFNIAKDMLLKMPSEISKKFSARIARFTINADESTIKKS